MLARLNKTRQVVFSVFVTLILSVVALYHLQIIYASGETRYVSVAGTDSGDCTTEASPCETIQYAVNQSSSGDTVLVAAGTYSEIVDITKDITLQGAQAGVDARSRSGSETIIQTVGGQNFTFRIRTDDVTVNGFTFDGSTGTSSLGVYLTGPESRNAVIVNNIFKNNKVGINGVYADVSGIHISNNLFDSNNVGAGSDGVFLGNSSGSDIEIIDNTFRDSGTAAIVVYGEPSTPLNNVRIENNDSTNDSTFVMAYSIHNSNISNNTTTDKTGTTIFIDQGVENLVIENNTLTNGVVGLRFNNILNPTADPIRNVTIKNNTISNMSGSAMTFSPSSIDGNIVLSDNTLSGNTQDIINDSGVELTIQDSNTGTEKKSSKSSNRIGSLRSAMCAVLSPTSAPDLFQVDVTDTKATLYFAPPSGKVNKYAVAYALTPNTEQYATIFDYSDKSGAITYQIQDLTPDTTYYFSVRGLNNCAPGPWSHEIQVKTKLPNSTQMNSYFKDGTLSAEARTSIAKSDNNLKKNTQ